ncbi:hypothetical protein B0H17DRAFT_1077054 [Mycena rosella]|uniref:Uncharacterized protein n=1 Tax=Mycena rosella TaxID=1033263 RepID=A0AAD7GBZ2_MYCRO|nr:hypothetical protein B0H17DRAFT_1077054 [Mycena rosella]
MLQTCTVTCHCLEKRQLPCVGVRIVGFEAQLNRKPTGSGTFQRTFEKAQPLLESPFLVQSQSDCSPQRGGG